MLSLRIQYFPNLCMFWNSQQAILLHKSRLYPADQLHSSCSVNRKALHLITRLTLEMRSWRLCPPWSKELFYIMKLKAVGRDFFISWAMGTAVKTHLAWMEYTIPELETTWGIGFGWRGLSWYRYADKARWIFVPSYRVCETNICICIVSSTWGL